MNDRGMNDWELFNSWLEGNRSAGLALLAKYQIGWVRYLRKRLGVDYDDILQEAMLACIEGHRNFRFGGNFGAYILGILRNKLHVNARRWRREHELADIARCQTLVISEIHCENDDKLDVVEAAMASLPPKLREVLLMRLVMKMTLARVAEALALPTGTVASRQRRAKAKLLELLAAHSSSSDDEI